MMRIAAVLSGLAAIGPALAVDTGSGADADLNPVVVTATRVAQASMDLPLSIDRVDAGRIRRGQLQVNLSETLDAVPGVSIAERQNYAQDLQLAVRGFGARSSFGVRGVRLYSDGIPGTMPDGQGQFSHFDLGSADRIEVLRGPFSALYGNSSGGVIAVFTEDAGAVPEVDATALRGSFGTERAALKAMGPAGPVGLVIDGSHFVTDGYRDHSSTERNLFNAKAAWQVDGASKLTVVANAIDMPDSLDPLGLTRAQLAANPSQAGTNAVFFDTRKSLQQQQLGADYERALGPDDGLTAVVYGGTRATVQFQAIPLKTEAPPLDTGGVIDLGRTYWGADVHVTDHRTLAGGPLLVTGGVSYDGLDEARGGYLNYIGTLVGVEGAVRRDQTNLVHDVDEYLQAQWDPTPDWRGVAGVRNSVVEIASTDHLAAPGDAHSSVTYDATNPVFGITYRAASHVDLYASYGKGFETPTLNDIAYRSADGSLPGLNFGLKPARSDNYEIGAKANGDHWRASLAAFFIKVKNELAVQSNSFGRTVNENIPETRRKGVEMEWVGEWPGGFSTEFAYTYLQALTAEPYSTCLLLPCKPTIVATGQWLPAVPANTFHGGLTWNYAPAGFSVTFEEIARSEIYVDDRNTDAAGGYWRANLHIDLEQQLRASRLGESLRVDNLADRRYVGSVIVNSTNGGFFEPAPGRTIYLAVNLRIR